MGRAVVPDIKNCIVKGLGETVFSLFLIYLQFFRSGSLRIKVYIDLQEYDYHWNMQAWGDIAFNMILRF